MNESARKLKEAVRRNDTTKTSMTVPSFDSPNRLQKDQARSFLDGLTDRQIQHASRRLDFNAMSRKP